MSNLCSHGQPLGSCDTCDQEIRAAKDANAPQPPLEELDPLRTWVREHADELGHLGRLCRGWPFRHNDLEISAPVTPEIQAQLILYADHLSDGLFQLCYAVADPDGNAELIEDRMGHFAIALVQLVEAPDMRLTVRKARDAPLQSKRTRIASDLLRGARAAIVPCIAAFMAAEGTTEPLGEA